MEEDLTRAERKRERTRAEILAAAREELRRNGLDRSTLTAVADAVGLTKPALYYYFSSREALVFEVLLDGWTGVAQAVADAVEATTTGEQALHAIAITYLQYFASDLSLFALVHHGMQHLDVDKMIGPDEIARIRPLNDLLLGGAEARLRADIEAGRSDPVDDPRRLAFVAMSAAIGLLTMKSMVEPAGDPLRHTDTQFLDTLGAVLRAATARST